MVSASNLITIDSLATYCKSHWSELYKEKMGNPGKNPKEAAALGYEIYTRSIYKGLGIAIIGPDRLRDDDVLVGNVGSVIGNSRVKHIKEESFFEHAGAILREKQWSGFINDLYMLGSVHARKEFHFSIPADRALILKDIWDANKKSLTTTGRELFLLLIGGYTKACLKRSLEEIFGHVFAPPSEKAPPLISLEEYRKAMRTFKDPQKILDFFYNRIPSEELSSINSEESFF